MNNAEKSKSDKNKNGSAVYSPLTLQGLISFSDF